MKDAGTATPRARETAPQPTAPARVGGLRETVGAANDVFEREADRVADAVMQGARWYRPGQDGWSAASAPQEEADKIRRSPRPPEALPVQASEEPAGAAVKASGALLVADDGQVERGQMRKSEFMTALRAGICAAVDAALAGTGRDSQGCPWIEHWLGYYETREATEIERSLLRFAPEAHDASTAAQYIRVVSARVSRSAQRWAKTGEVTGLPEEMPGASLGGGALAAVGALFFKAQPGGARSADPVSVRAQLGRGESLGTGLRTRMEGAFGTSFGAVRVHTDATAQRLSSQLNARAFAIGPHVAFADGEFQPGTLAGDALIAHELAHVVQQGHAGTSAAMSREAVEPGASSQALEHDADRSAAGVAAHLWGGDSFSGLRQQAQPRMRSGLSLQRCASTPKKAEVAPGAEDKAKAKLTPLQERSQAISGAGDRLRDLSSWITLQQKMQGVPNIKGVTGLDKEQAGNVATAIDLLDKANALSSAGQLDALSPKLDEVVTHLKEARKLAGASGGDDMSRQTFQMQGRHALNQAVEASDEAGALLGRISASLDVAPIKAHTDAIASALGGVQADPGTMEDAVDTVVKSVKAAKKEISQLRERSSATPDAIKRIVFVLRSFLALNAPDRTTAPSEAEIKAYMGTRQNGLAADLNTVFGEGKETLGFGPLILYSEILDKQLAVRAKMAEAKVDAKPIPTQGNAEDYFRSLKTKDNEEVTGAYHAYADAFFYHRVVDKFGDLDVTDVAELYTRPLTVFGVRPLVCTGFALLGAHLLVQAGATLKKFVVAVRATEDQIITDTIGTGHALAHLTRKGSDLWVTNATVEASKADAQRTVGWDPKDKTLHEAEGQVIPATNNKLRNALGKEGEAIRARRAKKK